MTRKTPASALRPFTVPYHFNGRDYTLEVFAHDRDDARQRLRAAYLQANPPEQVVARIPVASWAAKMIGGNKNG